jgi:hypothetical protein
MNSNFSDLISPSLRGLLNDEVTSLSNLQHQFSEGITIASSSPEAKALGIINLGKSDVWLTVANLTNKIGTLRIETHSDGNHVFVNNVTPEVNFYGSIRLLGQQNLIVFDDLKGRYVALHDVYFRGTRQFLFWGRGASAVGCSIEIEGTSQGVIVGDDALISSGVWVRNHNMHSVVDLTTRRQVSQQAVTTVLERHVWVGQNAILLKCDRIGKGSIVGASSLVRNSVPPMVAVAGLPAQVIRQNVSWGRDVSGMSPDEFKSLGLVP